MCIFSHHFTKFENILETGFQHLTWGFQGCRFRILYFQIYKRNYSSNFVYNIYIKVKKTKQNRIDRVTPGAHRATLRTHSIRKPRSETKRSGLESNNRQISKFDYSLLIYSNKKRVCVYFHTI